MPGQEKYQVNQLVWCRGVPAVVVDRALQNGTPIYWVRRENGWLEKAYPGELRGIAEEET